MTVDGTVIYINNNISVEEIVDKVDNLFLYDRNFSEVTVIQNSTEDCKNPRDK